MKIDNTLPLFLDCLHRWERRPSAAVFAREYAEPMRLYAGDFFDGFHPYLAELDWDAYRREVLLMDPAREEARTRLILARVEALFGFELPGEILLYGSFATMDGFARFDRGEHRVFLGVDESHGRGRYIDVLTAHELAHVARETRPSTWTGWGRDPKMSRREYREEAMNAIEHLFSEGLSCAVSELVVPGEPEWAYCYQDEDSLARIRRHAPALDRVIHRTLEEPEGDYGHLYDGDSYRPAMPDYAHYAWAWQWVRSLLAREGGDPSEIVGGLVGRCSKDLVESARSFRLESSA
jgi:hypothetical protein